MTIKHSGLFFVFSLFYVFFSTHLFASNTFEVQYLDNSGQVIISPVITRGNQNTIKVRLKITNSLGNIEDGTYNLKTFQSLPQGLYIENPVSSVNDNSVSLNLNTQEYNQMSITFTGASVSSVNIDFQLWAGFCFSFTQNDPNTKTLSSPFTLMDLSTQGQLALSNNNSIDINKGTFLDYQELESTTNLAPDNNKMVVFEYIVKNTSPTISFAGDISFKESNIGTAYDIREVGFYKMQGGVWTLIGSLSTNPSLNNTPNSNNNDFILQPVETMIASLLPGEEIKIQEKIILNGCLNNTGSNGSNPIINWGFTSYDMCGQNSQQIGTFITQSVSPIISYDLSNATGNHACFGDANSGAGGSVRSIKVKNDGNDAARNVMLRLSNPSNVSPIMIPYNTNDIYIKITTTDPATGTITTIQYSPNFTKYNIDYTQTYDASTLPSFIPQNFLNSYSGQGYNIYFLGARYPWDLFDFRVNGIMSQDEMNQYVDLNHYDRNTFPLSMDCVGGFDQKLVYDLFIDEYLLNGVSTPITLNPGDEIELFWKEYNCCFKSDFTFNDVSSPIVYAEYDDFCKHEVPSPLLLGNNRTLLPYTFDPVPAATTTVGELDKCSSTSDGNVERISSKVVASYSLLEPTPFYDENNGRIVFRIYLQNGFDLDKSLGFIHSNYGWGNNFGANTATDNSLFVQNSSTNCDNNCSGSSCNTGNVISSTAPWDTRFYVRLRPAMNNGSLLIAPAVAPVLVTSDSHIADPSLSLNQQSFTPDGNLIFNGSMYANLLYEVSFNISDLNAFYLNNGGNPQGTGMYHVSQILSEAHFDFDIRAYCAQIERPNYKVVMYLDKCTGEPHTDFQNFSGCSTVGLTGMIPIASFGNSMIVNCPGCKIPGGNVNIAILERADESKGLLDNNSDNAPDNSTSRLASGHPTLGVVAMGDILECSFVESMSEGSSLTTGEGVTINELVNQTPPYLLDNLYLSIEFSGEAKIGGANQNIDIISLEVQGTATNGFQSFPLDNVHIVSRAETQLVLRLTSLELHNTSYFSGQANSFRIKFKVGEISQSPVLCNVSYRPCYSPCDNCTDIGSMIEVNPATNPAFKPFTMDKVTAYGNNTLWLCTGFSNEFQFLPYRQTSDFVARDNNCVKTLTGVMTGRFINSSGETYNDVFINEYRTFIHDNLKFSIPIPHGYLAQRIDITNNMTLNGPLYYNETYTIDDATLINSLISLDASSTTYDKVANFTLAYSPITGSSAYSSFSACGAQLFCYNHNNNEYPDGTNGHFMMLGDQSYNVSVVITLIKDPAIGCTSDVLPDYNVTDDASASPIKYKVSSNLPGIRIGGFPSSIQSDLILANPNATLSSGTDYMPHFAWNSVPVLHTPSAVLNGSNIDGLTIPTIRDNSLIQIPVRIENNYTLNGQGPVQNADYPFIRIYGEALTQGLQLVGIYKGNKTIGNPAINSSDPLYNKYYRQYINTSSDLLNNGVIIGIDQDEADVSHVVGYEPFLNDGANHPVSFDYTLVFSYSCPQGCDPNIGCGTSSLPNGCLHGIQNLSVEYGWNCSAYPDFTDLSGICGRYSPLLYTINSAPVGLDVSTSLNGQQINNGQNLTLDVCTNSTYNVNINSCKDGNLSNMDILFSNIPNGVSVTNMTIAVGSFTVAADGTNPNLFHLQCNGCSFSNSNVSIDFSLAVSQPVADFNMQLTVSGSTYCGSSVSEAITNLTKVNPVISSNDQALEICNGQSIVIGPSSDITGTTYSWSSSPAEFSSTLFNPEVTPTQTTTYYLTVTRGSCSSTADVTVTVNPLPYMTLMTDAGASFLCSSPITLTASNQGGGTPFSIQPYYHLLWSDNSTGDHITVSTAGVYTVTITDANGCSNTYSSSVIDHLEALCPDPVCPGENPPLTLTNTNGVTGSYMAGWFKVGDASMTMITSITEEGDYYAMAAPPNVVPACTLTTEGMEHWPCHISFKHAPSPYVLSTTGVSGICPGDQRTVTVTNPTVNDLGNTSVVWTTSKTDLTDLTVTEPGTYYITATDLTTGCRTESNKIAFYGPVINLDRECYEGNKVKLTAGSNIFAGNYQWYQIDEATGTETPFSALNPPIVPTDPPVNSTVIIDHAGLYKVTNDVMQQCNTSRVIYEPLILTAAPNANIISDADGRFEGMSDGCNNGGGFITDFNCITDFPDDDPNTPNINYSDLPSHYMISNDVTSPPGMWNRNYWTGQSMSSSDFMLVDGETKPADQIVWKKTVPVQHGVRYLLKGNITNIDVNGGASKEIPEVEMRITYIDANGFGIRHDLGVQILYNNASPTWVEIRGLTSADAKVTTDNSRGEAVNAIIELIMKGGGAIGRDIGVDNISLTPFGLCDDVNSIKTTIAANDRISALSFVTLDFEELHTCNGAPVTFKVIDNSGSSSLVYTWSTLVNGSAGNTLGTGSTFTTSPSQTTSYLLTVYDPESNAYLKRTVTVYIENPALHITSSADNICQTTPIDFSVDQFTGIGNIGYQWYVDGQAVSGATSSTYSLTTLNKDNVPVKCELINQCKDQNNNPLTVYSNTINVKGPEFGTNPAGPAVSVCSGSQVQIGSSTVSGAVYSWSPATGLSDASISNPMASPASTTKYTLTATDANGCTAVDTVTVTVNASPTPGTITVGPATTVCSGQYVNVGVSYGSGPYTYTGPSLIDGGGGGGQGGFGYAGYAYTGGDFVLTKTNAAGCSTVTSVHLTVQSTTAITTGSISTSLCAGSSVSVPYTVNGCAILNSGNVFTAQLSDVSGDFTSPVSIGTLTGTTSGVISAVIPTTIPSGGSYRIRVISSNTLARGSDNGVDITINSSPDPGTISVSPSTTVCSGQYVGVSVSYGSGPYTYTGPSLINGGGGGGQGGFGYAGYAYTSGDFVLTKTNAAGCSTVTSVHLTVQSSVSVTTGSISTSLCAGTSVSVPFTVNSCAILNSGNVFTAQLSNSSGDFTSPVSIGTLTGTTSGVISAVIPTTIALGSGYRIRVISSNTTSRGSDNGVNIAISSNCGALSFDGSDDRAELPTSSVYPTTGDFTMEAWIQLPAQTSSVPTILSRRASSSPYDGFIFAIYGGTRILFQLNGTNYYNSTTFTSIYDNTCHHVAVTRSGGMFTFYLNGVALTSNPVNNSSISSSRPIWIGRDFISPQPIKGNISEIRIWNVARTGAQISGNLSTIFPNNTGNLIGYWRIDEPSGEVIFDSGTGGNNGFLGSNATQFDAQNPSRTTTACYPGDKIAVIDEPIAMDSSSTCSDGVTIFPNPFEGESYMTVAGEEGGRSHVNITDLNGRSMEELDVWNNEKTAIARQLPAGVYIVEITCERERIIHKIIKVE